MTTPISVNNDLFDINLIDLNQQKVSLDSYKGKKLTRNYLQMMITSNFYL